KQLARTQPLGREGLLVVHYIESLPVSAPQPAAPSRSGPGSSPAGRKPPGSKEPAPAKTRKVLTIVWDQPDAWCSDNASYSGTTDGYAAGDALNVTLQEQGRGRHKTSLKL